MHLKWILLGLLAVAAGGARAQDAEVSAAEKAAQEMVASFAWQDGEVAVDGAKARMKLDDRFRYLGAADARKVLENLWGKPAR